MEMEKERKTRKGREGDQAIDLYSHVPGTVPQLQTTFDFKLCMRVCVCVCVCAFVCVCVCVCVMEVGCLGVGLEY